MPNSESIGSLVEAWLPEYELAPERLLKLFQLLPSDAGLRQVEELVFVLEEFSFAAPWQAQRTGTSRWVRDRA